MLSEAERPAALKIKNEADLYNKAKNIRKSKETQKLVTQFSEQEVKIRKAQEMLKSKDALFSTKEDRVKRIKGAILSAMNRAIQENDKKAIEEIRENTNKLEKELFS